MLSVVIPTLDDEEGLAVTLAALVPAAAEGIVREVVVVDGGSGDRTLDVADATGCVILAASGPTGERLARGAAATRRGEFILFLKPGVVLDARWEVEAASFVERVTRSGAADRRAAVFRFDTDAMGAGARLARGVSAVASRLSGLPHPAQPLLVSRRLYGRLGGHRPLSALEDVDLVRRIGRTRIVRLRAAAAVVVPPRPAGPGDSAAKRARRSLVRALAALPVPTGLLARLHG